MRTITAVLFSVAGLFTIQGDLVECANGDRYHGKVLLVDEQSVKVQNEITGLLTIPRAKVSTITFGNPKVAQTAAASALPTNILSSAETPKFDAAAIEQVQNQFLGTATPEANQMFQDMVRGLISGKLDVGDVRIKAQSTLDELKDLQKDLGDDDATALLGSYASILENFIKQASPSTNATNAAQRLAPPSAGKQETK